MNKNGVIGVFLLVPTLLAILAANSSFSIFYSALLHLELLSQFNLHDFVNEALMALFFLLMGLEIKSEFSSGSLSTPKQAALPMIAAVGGCIFPALIYLIFNFSTSARSGWAIPMATDIAFAVGVISLFDKRVPKSLKAFLMALAVVDDLIAVGVIAFFYGGVITGYWLALSVASFLLIAAAKYFNLRNIFIYVVLALAAWFFVLKSGVHATVAGVVLGLMTPMNMKGVAGSPLNKLAHFLEPIIQFFVMPAFAFFNAGVDLRGALNAEAFGHPVFLGVLLGLFVGKPIGVISFSYFAVRAKIAEKINGVSWGQFSIIGFFAGIGFTMALFIEGLSFDNEELKSLAKLAIFAASIASAIVGSIQLQRSFKRAK